MSNYWLLKSEPAVFSIDDLENAPAQTTVWEGVRNYQARNFMREMQRGDLGFFYHSNAKPAGIAGIIKIVKTAYPDETAHEKKNPYYDSKSTPENPRWDCVEVKFIKKFPRLISLDEMKHHPQLKTMMLLHRSRLSIQPVTAAAWIIICNLSENEKGA